MTNLKEKSFVAATAIFTFSVIQQFLSGDRESENCAKLVKNC